MLVGLGTKKGTNIWQQQPPPQRVLALSACLLGFIVVTGSSLGAHNTVVAVVAVVCHVKLLLLMLSIIIATYIRAIFFIRNQKKAPMPTILPGFPFAIYLIEKNMLALMGSQLIFGVGILSATRGVEGYRNFFPPKILLFQIINMNVIVFFLLLSSRA